ncbi:peptidyl-prolyl cis-trans isomerase FKBP14 isoform X2 [Nematostella vectensis]|uniref:peptidyl-prolyl cis-trans isomerase FKBP14 isoform X2 n=1 Tax=Nematostella vectensis TaxID=45351 RepID=UPI00139014FE|nr:peptidyl-prolyl cis-trans isomerase FKBP14 isoform X2 [Nematostella vectensis]
MKLCVFFLVFCLVLITVLATEEDNKESKEEKSTDVEKKEEEEDGKVEVVEEKAAEEVKVTKSKGKKKKSKKPKKGKKKKIVKVIEEEEDEEEEEDPNAKIEVEETFVPSDCENKTKVGDHVVVHYTGWMQDGSLFDTTRDHRKGYQPFEFTIGGGTVIKGFEQGVTGMCVGQKRKIVIPPALAYGKKGSGDVPANTTLTYNLELFDVRKPPPHSDMFSHMDENGDRKLSREEVSAYMRKQAEAQFAPTYDQRWQHHHERMVDNVFEYEDHDEDGHISHEEFSGPKIQGMHHDEF